MKARKRRIIMLPTPETRCACPVTYCQKPAAPGSYLCEHCLHFCFPNRQNRRRHRRIVAIGVGAAIIAALAVIVAHLVSLPIP